MTIFIKKFNKCMSKRRPLKGDKKERTRSKRVCYNCSKNGHFIAQCPYESKEEDDDKKKKKDKSYNKDNKFFKKKSYGEAHIGKEWESYDDSSKSKSDEMAIIAIKSKSSSSKSLFPNLSKTICLMVKESKKKVSTNASSSPKYVSSDEDTLSSDEDTLSSDEDILSSDDDEPLPNGFCRNTNAMIKGLMKQVKDRDELLEEQEKLLVQERKSNDECKKLLILEKEKIEKLDHELA
jgi:hypothetical protein